MSHHDYAAAVRALRRSPGFAAVAILSLGLAIGLNTTTFGLLDAVLHPYVPYGNPDQLVTVVGYGMGADRIYRSGDMYRSVRDNAQFFSGIAPETGYGTALVINGRLVQAAVGTVGANFFQVLDVAPVVGRTFTSDSVAPTGGEGVVVSYRFWRGEFAANRHLGQLKLTIGDETLPVIGVMPASMHGPDLWRVMTSAAVQRSSALTALVRLRPGMTLAQVRAQLGALQAQMVKAYGEGPTPFRYRVDPVRPVPHGLPDYQTAMAGAALLILLIACANLANLMLARGFTRKREVALRMALGANGRAVVRFVMAECAVLALIGGWLGVTMSVWGIDLLETRMPVQLLRVGFVAHFSWRVVAFGVGATVATMLLFGLAPALRARRASVSDVLKDAAGTTTGRSRGLYSGLVVGEVALSLVVLMGSALMARAAYRVATYDFGVDASSVVSTMVSLPKHGKTPAGLDSAARFVSGVLARARSTAGVQIAATWTLSSPDGLFVTSDAGDGRLSVPLRSYFVVSTGYFQAVGLGLKAGRLFEEGDLAGLGAAIVDEPTARRLWPGQSPLGHRIKLGAFQSKAAWVPVVGVVSHLTPMSVDPDAVDATEVYVARRAVNALGLAPTLFARLDHNDPGAAVRLYRALSAGASITPIRSVMAGFRDEVNGRAFIAIVFGLFGLFALTLAAVGVYGVLSYSVGQRSREFAMRMALGAGRAEVVRMVMRDAAVMVLGGTAVGAVGALWAGKLLDHWLFNLNPMDAPSLIAAESVLVVVSLLACAAPAIRATRADPVELLRAT